MTLRELDLSPWFVRLAGVRLGMSWGSFLNVVIYRVPRGMSVVRPPSHCPGCGAADRRYDNMPVVSWVALRGRARCCGTRVSPRYVVVERLGGFCRSRRRARRWPPPRRNRRCVHAAAVFLADFALALRPRRGGVHRRRAHVLARPDHDRRDAPRSGDAGPARPRVGRRPRRRGGRLRRRLAPVRRPLQGLRGRPGWGSATRSSSCSPARGSGGRARSFALFAGAFQATLAAVVLFLVHGKIEEPEAVRADREELQKRAAEAGDDERKAGARRRPPRPPARGGLHGRAHPVRAVPLPRDHRVDARGRHGFEP